MQQEMKPLHVGFQGDFEYEDPYCFGGVEGCLDINVPRDATDADLKEIIYEAIGQRHGIACYDIDWCLDDTAVGEPCPLTATRDESQGKWRIDVERGRGLHTGRPDEQSNAIGESND